MDLQIPVSLFKNFTLKTFHILKVFDILKSFQKNRVIILMYHRFSKQEERFKICQSVFDRQIQYLSKNFNIISLDKYISNLSNNIKNYPDNSLVITIDDGYYDNYEYAYPVLKHYSVPATIFLTTDFIDKKKWLWANKLEYILKNSNSNSLEVLISGEKVKFQLNNFNNIHRAQLIIFNYCKTICNESKDIYINEIAKKLNVNVPKYTVNEFKALTWDVIKEMSNNRIDFGAHSMSHPILSKLSSEEIYKEIFYSKSLIEKQIGNCINCFCYPNGQLEDVNIEVINMLKKVGYLCAVSTINGANILGKTDQFFLKRLALGTDNIPRIQRILTNLY